MQFSAVLWPFTVSPVSFSNNSFHGVDASLKARWSHQMRWHGDLCTSGDGERHGERHSWRDDVLTVVLTSLALQWKSRGVACCIFDSENCNREGAIFCGRPRCGLVSNWDLCKALSRVGRPVLPAVRAAGSGDPCAFFAARRPALKPAYMAAAMAAFASVKEPGGLCGNSVANWCTQVANDGSTA